MTQQALAVQIARVDVPSVPPPALPPAPPSPPGWYPDPTGRQALCWWDGTGWDRAAKPFLQNFE